MNVGADFPEVVHFTKFLSIITVNNKKIIPKEIFHNNEKNSPRVFGNTAFRPIKVAANQPADKLIVSPESALSQGLEKGILCMF